MPTERAKVMAERRSHREGEAAGRADGRSERNLEQAASGDKSGWYGKQSLAAYFDCSVSWCEKRFAEGMPHTIIAGRVKAKPAECEPWLEERDFLVRKGNS
jgi:hypothetical protein